MAVTGESATVISFISDDADIGEAFDSVIEVLSRTCPSESVRRILAKNHHLPVKSSIYATKKSLFGNSLFRKCYICRI